MNLHRDVSVSEGRAPSNSTLMIEIAHPCMNNPLTNLSTVMAALKINGDGWKLPGIGN